MNPEKNIKGVWRGYKLFSFSGKVEQHIDLAYWELTVDDEKLTLQHSLKRKRGQTLPLNEWRLKEVKKQTYLYFGNRQAFEIITLEPEDLVVADIVKEEKIFFDKMPHWNQRIRVVIHSVRHLMCKEAQSKMEKGK